MPHPRPLSPPLPSPNRLLSLLVAVLLSLAAGQGWAASTTAEQAASAAAAWLRWEASPLIEARGAEVEKVSLVKGAGGETLYHVVRLRTGGFVVLAADDRIGPVLAYSPASEFDPAPRSPLVSVLEHDIAGRLGRLGNIPAAAPANEAAGAANGAHWKRLLEGTAAPGQGEVGTSSVASPRVDPLLESRWGQEKAGGSACYNYYTPPNAAGSANNYPCGCVATAMAQLMRFWQYPTAGVGTSVWTITVSGVAQTRALRGGDGSGGAYNWSQMPLTPSSGATDAQRQAIGALTHDAGVRLRSDYASGDTGANFLDVSSALRGTFRFAHASGAYNRGGELGAVRDTMINPNLHAGFPVLLGILGSAGGHAVVCDGYGYDGGGTEYHHLNMGWNGTSDLWYALPNINSSPYSFTVVAACVYNVYTSGSGEIISGRITDASGAPLPSATISASRQGGSTYTATTNGRGLYALAKVPSSSSYTVAVALPGFTFTSRTIATGMSTDNTTSCGNVKGADFAAQETNQTPRITSDAWADPARVVLPAGTNLHVVADDPDNRPAPLVYTWKPSGPASVTFSANGSQTACDTTATFSVSGSYTFQVQITDGAASVTSSTVSVKVVDPPTLRITAPNGGEIWRPGTQEAITWTTTGEVGNVDLDLSADDGKTWTSLAANSANSGRYTLTVPALTSFAMRVRVQQHGLPTPTDMSDVSFSCTAGASARGDFNGDGQPDVLWQQAALGQFAVWRMDGEALVASVALLSGGAVVQMGAQSGGWQLAGCGDFNADGKQDLVLQHAASGQVSVWLMNGSAFSRSVALTDAQGQALNLGTDSGGWRVVGCADFNADGKPDLLLQHPAQGWVSIWTLNGTRLTASTAVTDGAGKPLNLGTDSGGWRVAGWADFNGDGKPDILWHHAAQGRVGVWTLNGTVCTGTPAVTGTDRKPVDLGPGSGGWRIAACADYNADNHVDLLWQHAASGQTAIWRMNGTTFTGSAPVQYRFPQPLCLGPDSGGWRVVGCADVSGDGQPDILLQNPAQGWVSAWTMVNGSSSGSAAVRWAGGTPACLGADSGGWRVVGAGDASGDGKPDLLWQHPAQGWAGFWTLDGLTCTGTPPFRNADGTAVSLGTDSGGWRIVGAADLSGDGKLDLLWQHLAEGRVGVWTLDAGTCTGTALIQDAHGTAIGLGPGSGGWSIVGCADFNGDGKPDILLQQVAQGLVSVWTLAGTTFTDSVAVHDGYGRPVNLGADSGGWRIVGCADFHGDGQTDILWQHPARGWTGIWAMNGLTYTGSAPVTDARPTTVNLGPDSGGWRALGPR